MRAIAGLISVLLFVSVSAFAHTSEKPTSRAVKVAKRAKAPAAQAAEISPVSPEMLMFSVVKIYNNLANIFKPELTGAHGTGFYIGPNPMNPTKGLIFTNKHVIDSEDLEAQNLTVEFNTNDAVGELIRGKLLYVSPLHDFAVIEFDPAGLERADLTHPLALPDESSPFRDYVANARHLRGVETFAIGNPLDGENIVSFGEITGLQMDEITGPFIQTQAPINPGNSGGPLIVKATGEVVGINTAIIKNANNIGYATPVGSVMDEFTLWMNQRVQNIRPDASEARAITFNTAGVSEGMLRLRGLDEAFEKALPKYWHNHRTALMIMDVTEDNGLQRDDILLRMNGDIIGGYPYNLIRELQKLGVEVEMEVLRRGKVVKTKVSFPSIARNQARVSLDYVYVSGLFFREMARNSAGRAQVGVKSRVVVGGVVESAETSFMGGSFPNVGSIVAAVSFGGDDYPIESLLDLKKAINANRDQSVMQMRVYPSNAVGTGDGNVVDLISPRTGQPLVDGMMTTSIVPMREVLTPMQFSIHQFKKQFSFKQTDSHTWDWRAFRQPARMPSACEKLLARKKKRS